METQFIYVLFKQCNQGKNKIFFKNVMESPDIEEIKKYLERKKKHHTYRLSYGEKTANGNFFKIKDVII